MNRRAAMYDGALVGIGILLFAAFVARVTGDTARFLWIIMAAMTVMYLTIFALPRP